jgi:hypothetical protein
MLRSTSASVPRRNTSHCVFADAAPQWLAVKISKFVLSFEIASTGRLLRAASLAQLKLAVPSMDVAMPQELEKRINAIHQVHMNPAP